MPKPLIYKPATFRDEIVEWLAEGKTLRAYCKQDGKPTFNVVYRWRREDPEFAAALDQARDAGFAGIIEDTLEIADTVGGDPQSLKVRIWARHEAAKRLRPQTFGDRTTIAGDKDNPLIPQQLSDDERAAKIAAILNAANARKGN